MGPDNEAQMRGHGGEGNLKFKWGTIWSTMKSVWPYVWPKKPNLTKLGPNK